MYKDVLYATGAWMRKSGELQGCKGENCSCIFCSSAVRGGRMALLYGPMDSLEECKQKAAMDFIISSEIVFDPLDY